MRILFLNNHDIGDATAGMIQSVRTMLRWLAEAGHACQVLTTTRREPFSAWPNTDEPIPIAGVTIQRLHAPTVVTYVSHARVLMAGADLVIACNGEQMILSALADARRQAIPTVYLIRGYGYDHWSFFEDVDHVATCSDFLTAHYRELIGLESTPLVPPLCEPEVLAVGGAHDCLTFVHPAAHKGLTVFLMLAAVLREQRPDIPLLVVASRRIPAIDGVEQIDPVATPAEYLARTKILLMPSVWDEPFGRVAAEAMLNGIPPIVSHRGALPDTVGGDRVHGARVLALPHWLTPSTTRIPQPIEVLQWTAAITALWDDAQMYRVMSLRARAYAAERFGERLARARHLSYFTTRATLATTTR